MRDGSVSFTPVDEATAGCCASHAAAQTWLSAECIGAERHQSSSKSAFSLLLCPCKRSKDGKKSVRRFRTEGPFACETADAADNAVSQIRDAQAAQGTIQRDALILAIVNAKAGKGKGVAVWKQVEHALRCAGCKIQTEYTQHHQHAIGLVASADLLQVGCIAIVGGDGSFHEVVQVRMPEWLHCKVCVIFVRRLHHLAFSRFRCARRAQLIIRAVRSPKECIVIQVCLRTHSNSDQCHKQYLAHAGLVQSRGV